MVSGIDTSLLALLACIAFVCVGAMAWAYVRTRDPLHPMMYMGPLFLVGFAVQPLQAVLNQDIHRFFSDMNALSFVLKLYLAGITALFLGVLGVAGPSVRRNDLTLLPIFFADEGARRRLARLSVVLAVLASAAFWYGIMNAGGFEAAYGHAKGGGWSSSGYISEATMLCYPAVFVYALSRQGSPVRMSNVLIAFAMTSPGLIHGTFGGRRGPLFITLCALFFAWILARWRLPKWRTIGLVMLAIVAAVVFIQSQRRKVYLGSENKVDVNRFVELVRAPELSEGDNFVFSAGDILVTHETEFFHWGRTFVMNYVVRPVPKQLWPSKYDDAAEYLYGGGQTDLSDADWLRTVGWIPLSGSASNLVADLYAEFSWGAILGCWLLGRFIGVTWRNFRVRGGFWVFMYMCVGILSVYLPTQSFSAFFHRFLYMNIVTYLLWRYWMHPRDRMARPLRLQSVSPRKGVLKSQVSRELKAK